MYTVTLLTLSGSPSAEFELPPATSVGEILQKARATASDGRAQLKLLLQGRALQAKETLCSLGLPPPPTVVELQLICQPRLVERISVQTSDYQRVSIGICGQRRAGKTSLMNQYVDRAFVTDDLLSVIPIEFKIANLRVERDEAFVPVKLFLWDLHGRHRYEPRVHSNMFRNMVAILFVADLDAQLAFSYHVDLFVLSIHVFYAHADRLRTPRFSQLVDPRKACFDSLRLKARSKASQLRSRLH